MKGIVLLFVSQFVFTTNLFAQSADINHFSNNYIDTLEKNSTPALYSNCKTQDGKAVLIFSLDGKQGRLFELKDDKVINSAPVVITHKRVSIDVSETQGGVYTYTVLENHAKDLLELPFKFSMPEDLTKIMKSMPSHICIDKPPK